MVNAFEIMTRGKRMLVLGNFSDAINAFQEALQVLPDDESIWYQLGIAFSSRGDIDSAVNACRKAVELKPDYKEAWNYLSILLAKSGDIDGSIAACNKALAIDPDYLDALNNLAVNLKRKGNFKQAMVVLKKVIALNPQLAQAWHNIGNLHEKMDNIDASIDAIANVSKVTFVLIRKRRRDVPFRNAFQITGRDVQRIDNRIQCTVKPIEHLPVAPRGCVGCGPG